VFHPQRVGSTGGKLRIRTTGDTTWNGLRVRFVRNRDSICLVSATNLPSLAPIAWTLCRSVK